MRIKLMPPAGLIEIIPCHNRKAALAADTVVSRVLGRGIAAAPLVPWSDYCNIFSGGPRSAFLEVPSLSVLLVCRAASADQLVLLRRTKYPVR
jgi:hypothetical protein